MSDEWFDVEVDVEATPGPPAVRKPKEMSDMEVYRAPSTLSAGWIEAQLTKKDWAAVKKSGTRLNPQLILSMCQDAKKGLSKRSVMARHGYSTATWGQWERKAAEGQQPYALWYQCMMYSISMVEEDLIDNIRMQSQGDWKAAKWLLEQLNKDEYSPATQGNTTVNVAGDINTTNNDNRESSVNYMSDEKALEVAKLLQGFGVIPQIENVVEGEVVSEANDSDS